ncbi:transglycosylase domain-containing protein [Brevibacterium sp. 50QC2O2]|uniref:transglycosylase domain-containing protein n=1 Tax=unclassified Brevibacterium TaxID=2614124 RepID=UPI003592EA26
MGRVLNYPRAGKSGFTRWLPSFRLWVTGVLGLFVIVVAGFAIGYSRTPIPQANVSATGATTNVYYDDGKKLIGQLKIENRQPVAPDKISPTLKAATVAAEDRSFYENRGINVKGLGRAVWGLVTNDYAGGGSSITQQYVKNYYLTNDHSMVRKAKEMFIALKIDQELDKDQILANYLNTIYLGRGAYGAEVASQNYFHKPAADLDYKQAALLAAIIQRPGAADPADNPEVYQGRYNYVIQGMVERGNIPANLGNDTTMPKVYSPKKEKGFGGQTGYMLRAVVNEMKAQGLSEDQIYRGGYKIVTTFNKKDMDAALDTVQSLPKPKKGMHIGLVSIDPKTGGIRAMYGGKDYLKQQFNDSLQGTAQAGSTFKPFALVAGIEDGYRLGSSWPGSQITIRSEGNAPWTVHNFGGSSYGTVSLLKATESSVNTAYGYLNKKVGPEKTQEAAIRAGLPESTQGLDKNLSNVLGTSSPRPVDMANAYATFAAQGIYRKAHVVEKATDGADKVVYQPDTEGERKFDKAVMAETTYALRHVISSGSGSYASSLGRPAAGKTGTSSDNYSAWFTGYTPQRATVVSISRTKAKKDKASGEMRNYAVPIGPWGSRGEVTGGSYPVQAWTHFMRQSLEGTDVKSFPSRPSPSDLPKLNTGGDDDQYGSGNNELRGNSNRSSNSRSHSSSNSRSKARHTEKAKDESDKKKDREDSKDKGKDKGSADGKGKSDGDGKDGGKTGIEPPKKPEKPSTGDSGKDDDSGTGGNSSDSKNKDKNKDKTGPNSGSNSKDDSAVVSNK